MWPLSWTLKSQRCLRELPAVVMEGDDHKILVDSQGLERSGWLQVTVQNFEGWWTSLL